MNIIGINYLSESSVCYLKNGKLINAISEERINRIKNWYGIPLKSIEIILKKNNLKYSDIDFFVTSGILAVLGGLSTIGYLVKTGKLPLFQDDENKDNSEKIVVDEDNSEEDNSEEDKE